LQDVEDNFVFYKGKEERGLIMEGTRTAEALILIMEGTRTAEALMKFSIAEILLGSSRNSSWRDTETIFSRIFVIFI